MSNIIEGITKDLTEIPKNLKAKAGGMDTKKLVLLNLPYIFAGYFCDKVAWLWRVSEGTNASDKMMAVMNRFDKLFANPLPSFPPRDLLIGVAGGIALRLVVYYKAKNAKKFRQGVEYGSARWGNAKDIEPYMDSVFENNVLLTQTERLMMSGRPKEPKYARNKNILVIGGSGSGKTCFFVKPNLMQMHSSYVVTDLKGTVKIYMLLIADGFFLCTRPAKTADVQSFIKKQESITFPNEPFNSIGAFSTEQEQNMLLKRIQIKLKLNGRCQTVNSTPQVSIPCGNKNFFKSDSIVKHGEDLQPYLEVLL